MPRSTPHVVVTAVVFTLIGATLATFAGHPDLLPTGPTALAQVGGRVRSFDLEMVAQDLDMGGGATWHAWTFNHTVPGPTLVATVGDVVRVTVRNSLNVTHSFHTHFSPYTLENDGSQLNTITGVGGMAMIPAGGAYTYQFLANVPGLFYYHDHSAAGGGSIHANIAQGLYGAIIVKAVNEPPVDDQVVFMAERGFDVSKPDAPFFIMNGKGLPGGEKTLEAIFAKQGLPGVVAQVGTTLPVLSGRVGVPIRIDVVNIGDVVHSFHLHGMTAYLDDGRPLPAQVLGLDPGEADRVTVTPTQAGLWLYHCHVVSHADAGMIGVFLVQPATGSLDLPAPATGSVDDSAGPTGSDDMAGMPGMDGTQSSRLALVAGGAGELTFAPAHLAASSGKITVAFHNGGKAIHSVAFPSLGVATPAVPPGGDAILVLDVARAGEYAFACNEPGHADAGMRGTLSVKEG